VRNGAGELREVLEPLLKEIESLNQRITQFVRRRRSVVGFASKEEKTL
jgi:hypothetical protein